MAHEFVLVRKAQYENMLTKLKDPIPEHQMGSVIETTNIDASELNVSDTSNVSDKARASEFSIGDKANASEFGSVDKSKADESHIADSANLYAERSLSDMNFVSQKRKKRHVISKRKQRRPLKSVGNSKWINYLI